LGVVLRFLFTTWDAQAEVGARDEGELHVAFENKYILNKYK
jgi:hypothetical protein